MLLHSSHRLATWLAIACAIACGRVPPAAAAGTLLTEADSGRSLTLPAGASFAVQLRASPGTGYTWEVTQGDPRVVAQQGSPTPQPIGPARPGGPALETFAFQARGAGTTRLEIVYRRPWEQGRSPAKTFAIEVTVR